MWSVMPSHIRTLSKRELPQGPPKSRRSLGLAAPFVDEHEAAQAVLQLLHVGRAALEHQPCAICIEVPQKGPSLMRSGAGIIVQDLFLSNPRFCSFCSLFALRGTSPWESAGQHCAPGFQHGPFSTENALKRARRWGSDCVVLPRKSPDKLIPKGKQVLLVMNLVLRSHCVHLDAKLWKQPCILSLKRGKSSLCKCLIRGIVVQSPSTKVFYLEFNAWNAIQLKYIITYNLIQLNINDQF